MTRYETIIHDIMPTIDEILKFVQDTNERGKLPYTKDREDYDEYEALLYDEETPIVSLLIDDGPVIKHVESLGISFKFTLDTEEYFENGIKVDISASYYDEEVQCTLDGTTTSTVTKNDIVNAIRGLLSDVTTWDDNDIYSNIDKSKLQYAKRKKHQPEKFDINKKVHIISEDAADNDNDFRPSDKTLLDYLDEAEFDYLTDLVKKSDDPYRLETLKEAFNCFVLNDEEFLKETPWNLMGITAHQFHAIDAENLNEITFESFVNYLTNSLVKETIPDVISRIKYATVVANLHTYNTYGVRDPEEIKYASNIANKRTINDAITYMLTFLDYLHFRPKAIRYNEEYVAGHETETHKVYDYPRFPKPSRLQDLHDKAARDAVQYDNETATEEREAQNKLIHEINKTPDYLQYLCRSDEFSVIPAESVEDLVHEGEILHHCIGTYGEKFSSKECYIYFLRQNQNIDKPFYSAELTPNRNYTALTQLYTYNDSTYKTPEFKQFVLNWCKEKHIIPKCEI